jgi:hypothetical protein
VIRPHPIRDLSIEGGGCISAGSGLVRTGDYIYVIADDERELGVFPAQGHTPGRLARFHPGERPADPAERKREKPDLEALAFLPGALLALGSGSESTRRGGALWDLDERGALAGEPRRLDLGPLYDALDRDIPDLNIEGATVSGGQLLLFQRGNGRGAVNAVIALDLGSVLDSLADGCLEACAVAGTRRHELGEVDGVRLCFTDATGLHDGRVLFTAVAERGEDTYNDGECVASGVGLIDAQGNLTRWSPLDPALKVEGIEARCDGDRIMLLLVADADDAGTPSFLYGAPLDLLAV